MPVPDITIAKAVNKYTIKLRHHRIVNRLQTFMYIV
jgi:hypothetical protein